MPNLTALNIVMVDILEFDEKTNQFDAENEDYTPFGIDRMSLIINNNLNLKYLQISGYFGTDIDGDYEQKLIIPHSSNIEILFIRDISKDYLFTNIAIQFAPNKVMKWIVFDMNIKPVQVHNLHLCKISFFENKRWRADRKNIVNNDGFRKEWIVELNSFKYDIQTIAGKGL